MKKFLIWTLVLLAVAVVFYLVQRGVIRWQPLTVLVAALLAPFKFISGLFDSNEEKIRERHRQTRAREADFQAEVGADVQRRERRATPGPPVLRPGLKGPSHDLETDHCPAGCRILRHRRHTVAAGCSP